MYSSFFTSNDIARVEKITGACTLALKVTVVVHDNQKLDRSASAMRKWRDSELFDLVVGRSEIGQRHGNRDGFLAEILKRDFELLARFQRRQQVRCDRRAGVAAAVFTGLD